VLHTWRVRRLAGFGCTLALLAAAPSQAAADGHVWVNVGDAGRLTCGVAPAGWQRAGFDDRGWSEHPIVFERREGGPAPAAAVAGETAEPQTLAIPPAASRAGDTPGNLSAGSQPQASDAHGAAGSAGSSHSAGAQLGNPPARPAAVDAGHAGALADELRTQPSADGGVSACVGARFVRWHFVADPAALAGLRALTLRVRYTHGFAAYLDGVEIARRRLDAAAPPDGLASDVHGLEFESFTIPARGLLHAGDNVLAIEVHPHTAGRSTALEASLSGDAAPRMIRGPYLLGVRETEATIVVDTDLPTTVALTWGPRAESGATVTDPLGVHHVLKLTKLKPGAVYHYRVRARAVENAQSHNENAQLHNENAQSHNENAQSHSENAQLHNENAQSHNENAQSHSENAQPHNENAQSPDDMKHSHNKAAAPTTADAVVDSGDTVFHTPADAGRPLRFAVYGDVRSGHDIHAALNRSLLDEQPDLAILTGDLVDRGTDEGEWESFFEVAGPLLRQVCIFPAVGNHEYAKQGHGLAAFMQLFRWPIAAAEDPSWYSYDISGAHFVALDSDQYKSPRQLGWFEHDLREARRRHVRAIFVYAHEGPASSGLHGDNPICVRDYVPIMQRYHVSMFFGGHDHDYERGRTGTLDYVVTGGGGAELRAARCGVPGKRACPARCAIFVNDHNYVMVELLPSLFRVCPKRVDGTPIEACIQYPLRQ
jgi:hypothetical protein